MHACLDACLFGCIVLRAKVRREKSAGQQGEPNGFKREKSEKPHAKPTPPVLLSPRNGFIAAGGSCVVEVRCQAPLPGWQQYVVVVRNLKRAGGSTSQQDHALRIRVQGVHPHYLNFPDVTGEEAQRELCVGMCYVDPHSLRAAVAEAAGGGPRQAARSRFVKQQPFRIKNLQGVPYRLSVTSNLTKQVFIFQARIT